MTTEQWPDWLEDLSPEDRVGAITQAVADCHEDHGCGGSRAEHRINPETEAEHLTASEAEVLLLRLLDEARESARTTIGLTDDPDPVQLNLPGSTAVRFDRAGRVIAVDRISGEQPGPDWLIRDLRGGTYGDFHRLRPAAECFDAAGCAGQGEHDAGREVPEAHRPIPLLPDGTYVEVQIKGHQRAEGYLTAGTWHGEPYGFLADEGGAFVAAFPPVAGSVHLITAVPEPGSQPEQPDPWSEPSPGFGFEAMRAEVEATRRLLAAANLKTAALAGWTTAFVDGDATALAEVREIFERDFTQEAADAEPPF